MHSKMWLIHKADYEIYSLWYISSRGHNPCRQKDGQKPSETRKETQTDRHPLLNSTGDDSHTIVWLSLFLWELCLKEKWDNICVKSRIYSHNVCSKKLAMEGPLCKRNNCWQIIRLIRKAYGIYLMSLWHATLDLWIAWIW